MTWEIFYLCCFSVGLVLCLLSVFTGGGHGHLHLPHVGHTHVHAPHGAGAPVVNGFTLTAFLCWFGGAGYLLHHASGIGVWLVLFCAALSGLVGAAVIFWFLSRVLLPHDRSLTAEDTAVLGAVGRIGAPLQPGGTGEMQYTQLGVRRSVPVRTAEQNFLAAGTEVVVLRYEHGIAYVRPWNEFDL